MLTYRIASHRITSHRIASQENLSKVPHDVAKGLRNAARPIDNKAVMLDGWAFQGSAGLPTTQVFFGMTLRGWTGAWHVMVCDGAWWQSAGPSKTSSTRLPPTRPGTAPRFALKNHSRPA